MMKSIFKAVLLVAAASLTLTAFAGEKHGRGHVYSHGAGHNNGHGNGHSHGNGPQMYPYYELIISGYEGSLGSSDLLVLLFCDESPDRDNEGRTVVHGSANINGRIATEDYISESESFEGFDACPANETSVSNDGNLSFTISVGGNTVTAECSGLSIERTKYKVQNKYPGQEVWETYEKIGQGNVTDYEELVVRSCNITAMDSSGNTEIFAGIDASASIRKGFQMYY